MVVGEICLQTNDVISLADLYRWLLGAEGENTDPVHQFILDKETTFTTYNDGVERSRNSNHRKSVL